MILFFKLIVQRNSVCLFAFSWPVWLAAKLVHLAAGSDFMESITSCLKLETQHPLRNEHFYNETYVKVLKKIGKTVYNFDDKCGQAIYSFDDKCRIWNVK